MFSLNRKELSPEGISRRIKVVSTIHAIDGKMREADVRKMVTKGNSSKYNPDMNDHQGLRDAGGG